MITWLEVVTIIISTLTLLGFGVVMKQYWEDKHARKVQNSEEVKQRAKTEKQEETREVFREEMAPLIQTIDQIKAMVIVTSAGTVTLLRDRMKTSLGFCKKQKWASSSDKANWIELYNTYKTMGGNHFREYVDQWKQQMEMLPSEEEYNEAKRKKSRTEKIDG